MQHNKKTIRVSVQVLKDLMERLLTAAGCSYANAAVVAEGFLEADTRGVVIQGLDHIYSTIEYLESGRLNGKGQPRLLRETPSTALVEGDGTPGQVGGMFATDVAIRKARSAGLGVVGLVNSGDVFMLSYYANHIVEKDLVGFIVSNAYTPDVHPTGGMEPVIGTNPIAIAIPLENRDPLIVDLATSASAVGHIRIASYYQEKILEGLALDKQGSPTTDAREALKGSLSPLGGIAAHKGYGLGLAAALLSGPLIGALIGNALANAMEHKKTDGSRGHFFMAIDPGFFGDRDLFKKRSADYLDYIKKSRLAPGFKEIRIPGEVEYAKRRKSLSEGIDVLETIWSHTALIADRLGVAMPQASTVV